MPDTFEYDVVAPDKFEAEYHYGLGRLMHNFALVEVGINELIFNFIADQTSSGQKEKEIIMSILGGFRFSPAIDHIKRLLRVSGEPDEVQALIKTVLDHLGEIQWLRDKLAHNAAGACKVNGEWWRAIGTITTIREMSNLEIIHFSHDMLHAAADDLCAAMDLLNSKVDTIGRLRETLFGFSNEDSPQIALPAWQYKPSQLKRTGPKFRRNPSKHAHPRGSSPA